MFVRSFTLSHAQLFVVHPPATIPQLIDVPKSSIISATGRSVRRNCSAAFAADGGQPPPTVRWYHNGHAVRTGSVVRLLSDGAAATSDLDIRSFDQAHQGTYQCVAETAAGEVQATLMLTLPKTAETALRPLRSVTCYPYNATAYLIGFESGSKIDGVLVHQVNGRPTEQWATSMSERSDALSMGVMHGKYVLGSWWLPYRPFGVIVRGMQKIGFEIDRQTDIFAMSPLSAEVSCALQGRK